MLGFSNKNEPDQFGIHIVWNIALGMFYLGAASLIAAVGGCIYFMWT